MKTDRWSPQSPAFPCRDRAIRRADAQADAQDRCEILARRAPQPPAEFLAVQISRLSEALLVSYGAMGGGNLEAVDRVVKIVRELDRYHGFAGIDRVARADERRLPQPAPAPLALAGPDFIPEGNARKRLIYRDLRKETPRDTRQRPTRIKGAGPSFRNAAVAFSPRSRSKRVAGPSPRVPDLRPPQAASRIPRPSSQPSQRSVARVYLPRCTTPQRVRTSRPSIASSKSSVSLTAITDSPLARGRARKLRGAGSRRLSSARSRSKAQARVTR